MKDKQIIIDGVDVSGCDFVFVGKDKKVKIACWCNKLNIICKENSNCYYKQLKRKEQECEELKKEIKTNSFGCFNIEMSEQLDQLKSELEQEKNWHKTSDEISKANSEYTVKLKQTLAEIKEIAENGKRFAERYMITGEQKANVLTYANAIIQKISDLEV